MSSQKSAIQRHDMQLAALVEGKNWRQALTLCEKRLRKGGQSEELLVRGNSLVIRRTTHSSKNHHRCKKPLFFSTIRRGLDDNKDKMN